MGPSAQPEIVDAEQCGGVGPGVDRAEARLRRQRAKLGDRVFVRIFGMDQFALGEMDVRAGDPSFLIGETADVDFDPPLDLVIEGDMLEPVDVEIAIELAVDPYEEVEVELRGYPGPVVVGGIEDLRILLQIDADQ